MTVQKPLRVDFRKLGAPQGRVNAGLGPEKRLRSAICCSSRADRRPALAFVLRRRAAAPFVAAMTCPGIVCAIMPRQPVAKAVCEAF